MNPKSFFQLPVQQTPSFKSPLTKTPRDNDKQLGNIHETHKYDLFLEHPEFIYRIKQENEQHRKYVAFRKM